MHAHARTHTHARACRHVRARNTLLQSDVVVPYAHTHMQAPTPTHAAPLRAAATACRSGRMPAVSPADARPLAPCAPHAQPASRAARTPRRPPARPRTARAARHIDAWLLHGGPKPPCTCGGDKRHSRSHATLQRHDTHTVACGMRYGIRGYDTQSRRRRGRGEPSPGADVAGVSPVPAQMWAGASPVPAQMWATVRRAHTSERADGSALDRQRRQRQQTAQPAAQRCTHITRTQHHGTQHMTRRLRVAYDIQQWRQCDATHFSAGTPSRAAHRRQAMHAYACMPALQPATARQIARIAAPPHPCAHSLAPRLAARARMRAHPQAWRA